MSKTYSAGIVTAYGAAKRAGYHGTYEDFCRQQAGYAGNAATVEQAKNTAVSAASTATEKAGEAATAATAAQTAKTQTEASATTASTKASEASASATSAGQSAANAAAFATNAANAASAAQAVKDSIPQDYTELSSDVTQLKADLGVVDSMLYTEYTQDDSTYATAEFMKYYQNNPSNIPQYTASTSYTTLKFIPINNVSKMKVSGQVGHASLSVPVVAFYNSTQSFVSYGYGVETGAQDIDVYITDIPSTAAYACVCFKTNSVSDFTVVLLHDYKVKMDELDTATANVQTLNANVAQAQTDIINLGMSNVTFETGKYIATNINPVDVTAITTDTSYAYALVECAEGDVFHITGTGGVAARLFCFVDSSGNVLEVSANRATRTNAYLIAPVGTAYLIVNVVVASTYNLYTLSPFSYVFVSPSSAEYRYGQISGTGVIQTTTSVKKSFITRQFVDTEKVTGFIVNDINYKVAVGVFNGSTWVRNDAWYTVGQSYSFADGYNYLIYVKAQDETEIYDIDPPLNAIKYIISTAYMHSRYEDKCAELESVKADFASSIKKVMSANYDITYANANHPISLKSYMGNNQNVHPKVLYFPSGFANHKYWMAYTPYQWNNSDYENPCIAYSDDGYTWENIEGNPLDDPSGVGYNSDTHLLYRSDTNTLEVWYRYVSDYDTTDPVTETIYRQTSTDGITWTQKEQVYYNNSGRHSDCLSPCAIWDGEKYLVWWINWSEKKIKFYNVSSALQFTWIRDINFTYSANGIDYDAWHLDVIIDNGLYIALVMCKEHNLARGAWSLFMTTSADNETYITPYLVMQGSDGWDEYMYRSSIVKVGDVYRIYYSALDTAYVHGIGISESKTLNNFIGQMIGK